MPQLQESLEQRGPAPIPSTITEHPLQKEKYKGHKRELYHLAGVLIDEVVIRMVGGLRKGGLDTGLQTTVQDTIAGAYGLEEDDDTSAVREFYITMESDDIIFADEPFEAITDGMEKTFQLNWNELKEEIGVRKKGEKNTPLQDIYDRYKFLTARLGVEPERFLTYSLSKKLDLMRRLTFLVPHLYADQTDDEIDAERFEEIAYASFPLIERIASSNICKSMQFLDAAFGGWNDWTGWKGIRIEFFQLTKSDGKLHLDLSKQGEILYSQSSEAEERTVGCPALTETRQSFTDFEHTPAASPLEKVWRWYVNIVGEHLLEEVKQDY